MMNKWKEQEIFIKLGKHLPIKYNNNNNNNTTNNTNNNNNNYNPHNDSRYLEAAQAFEFYCAEIEEVIVLFFFSI